MKKLFMFASAAALLAGCSQDLTEDLAPVQVAGKSTIYATYEVGSDATRTVARPNEDNTFGIFWEAGDAIGVLNAKEGAKNNDYFGFSGQEGMFTGDTWFLEDGKYIGYYPHADGRTIGSNGEITLTIPAEQKYRSKKADTPEGSFATNVAPAVAYGEAEDDETLHLTFNGVASYLRIPMIGAGTVKTMKLEIVGEDETNVVLAGDITVNMDDVLEGKVVTKGTVYPTAPTGDGTSITLNCGKGVELDKTTKEYFWFVIPSGLQIQNELLKLTINEGEPTEAVLTRQLAYSAASTTPINTSINMWANDEKKPWEWIAGAEDAVKIDTPEDFLKYAYLATYGKVYHSSQNKGEAVPTAEEVGKFYTEDGALRPAIFMDDINMADLKISTEHKDYVGGANGEKAKYNAFEEAVYYWWYSADNKISDEVGGAVSTIGDAKCKIAYSIDGRGFSLKGLNVNGNGLFLDTFTSTTNVASDVKNLVLDGVTVYAGDAAEAYFLTNRLYPSYKEGKSQGVAFTNVTVNENCALVAEKAAAAKRTALVGTAYTSDFEDWMEKEVKNETELPFIDKLAVIEDVDLTEYEKKFYNIIAIHAQGEGAIVTVADAAEAHKLIKNIAYLPASNKGVWYSVVDKKENYSYWTGWTPAEDKYLARQKDVVTAEMLAYYVKNGEEKIELTNNIDLGYGKNYSSNADFSGFADGKARTWETQNNAIEVDGKGFTIRQATVTTGLFGAEATVNDLKVNAAFVDGGYLLAKTGTAQKVTATGLTYNNAKPINDVLAGLFYEADIETAAETTDCTVSLTEGSVDPATICNFGYLYGVLGIDLSGSDDDVYKIAAPAKDSYGAFKCFESEPCVNENGKGSTTYVVFTGDITELPQAEETIIWGTPTPEKGHTIFFCTEKDYVPGKVYGNGIVFDGNVEFAGDVTVDGSLTIAGNGNYDLGGHTLSSNGTGGVAGETVSITEGTVNIKNGTIESAEDTMGITVLVSGNKEAHVTLEEVEVRGVYPVYLYNNNEATTLTIKSGTFVSGEDSPAVYVELGGKVKIEGGIFGEAGVTNDFLINIKDNFRKPTTDKEPIDIIEITGGTFINFNPLNNRSEGPNTSYVPAGYNVKAEVKGDDTYYTVVKAQ